jgi:hypothetical protein
MDRYESPFAFPDEHMRLLGIIAAHWELNEYLLGVAIAGVMQQDYGAVAVLLANVGFQQKCDLLLAYARHFQTTDPAEWSKFTKTIDALRDAYSTRNRFIHAKWKMVEGEIRRTEVRTRGGKFTIADDPAPISELNAAAQQIIEAGEAFVKLVEPYGIFQKS